MNTELLQEKWKNYLFLTVEMQKFLIQRELDMFLSLVDQRENLQNEISSLTDDVYYASSAGKKLLNEIQQVDQKMMIAFHTVFSAMKKRENVSHAYEGMSSFAGNHFNSKT